MFITSAQEEPCFCGTWLDILEGCLGVGHTGPISTPSAQREDQLMILVYIVKVLSDKLPVLVVMNGDSSSPLFLKIQELICIRTNMFGT